MFRHDVDVMIWIIFTTIGAFVAFGNAAFLLWDRMLRYRPIVSVTTRLLGESYGDPYPALRLKNIAPFDIVIERFVIVPQDACYVSAGHSTLQLATAITNQDVPIILPPGAERVLPLVVGHRDQHAPTATIKIVVEWRRAQSVWLRQCPVTVRTSFEDMDLRVAAAKNK